MKDQPYPSYKNSNILWVGNIPIHWKIKRIKHVTKVNGRVGWQGLSSNEFIEEGPYLVTGTDFIQGGINWSSCYHVSEERYMKDLNIQLHEDDLLITKDGTIGKTAIVKNMPYKACLNSGIFVTRPITEDYNNLYLYWVLNSTIFDSFINYHTKIGTTISHLYQYIFVDFSFPIPSLQEQQNISAFLDREIQKIDLIIKRRKQQIELLKEKRDTLINHVITKGLDPDAPLKDTNIVWLGEIPEHWNVRKLKYIASTKFSNVDKRTVDGEQPVRLCNYTDVYYNDYITEDLDFMKATAKPTEIKKNVLKKGDVIITKDSETWDDIAVPAYVSTDFIDVLCGYHLAQILPNTKIVDGKYLFRSFSVRGINDQFRIAATGVTRYGLGKYDLNNAFFIVPPMQEQYAISDYLDQQIGYINKIPMKIQESIEKLYEYRLALISTAVTGKIDVRKEVA